MIINKKFLKMINIYILNNICISPLLNNYLF